MSEDEKKLLQELKKIPRKYKTIKIDKEWISTVKKPGWQRDLYRSRVNAFINHIKNETFYPSTITVNRVDDEITLIDGQHKIEAIDETGIGQQMDLKIYENLTDEQAKAIYIIENDVKGHRIIDDVKLYVGSHDWLDAVLDESMFPINVNVGITSNSIRIDRMLNILSNGLFTTITRRNLSRKRLREFMEEFDADKFRNLKDFCILYKKCFGDPSKDNWVYTRNTVMFTLMRIWMKNKDNFNEETIIHCFKEIENRASVRQDAVSVDVATLEIMTRKIYRIINKGRSVNKFEYFWED